MFITVVFATLLFCGFLTLRDRIKYPRLSSHTLKRTLKKIAEQMALSEWDEAERKLNYLIQKNKGGKEAILLLVQVLRGTKRHDEALELVLKAGRNFPEELYFRLEEAKIYLEIGLPEQAIAAFKVCAPILRSESDFYNCALACYQNGSIEHCWELIEDWLPQSQNGKMLALAGDCLFEKAHYSEAIELYQRAVASGSPNHQTLKQLGHSYRKLGNLGQAEKIFYKILDKDPGDVSATLGLGACMQERGNYQKALLFYQSGSAWEKKDLRILRQAGICALITKKYLFAAPYFAEVIQAEGSSAQLLFYYGFSLEGQKNWQEAEQAYLRLVREFPIDPKGHRALAWLYGVGLSTILSMEQGLSHAYVALKLLPDSISWEILSACEARRGNFEKAHQIQEYLLSQENDKNLRLRHQHAMRSLRKQIPLDEQQVVRSQVA